jgi:hypothetical protein
MVVASRRSRWQSGHVRQRASRSRLTMTEPAPGAAAGDEGEAGAPRRALFLLLPPLLGSSAPSPSSSCTGGGSSLTLGSAASAGGESGTGSVGGGGEVGPGCMGLVGSRCGVGKARRRGRGRGGEGREEVGASKAKAGRPTRWKGDEGRLAGKLDAKAKKAKAWLMVFVPHTLPSQLHYTNCLLVITVRFICSSASLSTWPAKIMVAQQSTAGHSSCRNSTRIRRLSRVHISSRRYYAWGIA